MHSLWLRITKFHLLLRQHSHLKCTIAVHSGSYFRGWGFLNPLFHIVVTKMHEMRAKCCIYMLYLKFSVFSTYKQNIPLKEGGNELIQKQKHSTSVKNMLGYRDCYSQRNWVNCPFNTMGSNVYSFLMDQHNSSKQRLSTRLPGGYTNPRKPSLYSKIIKWPNNALKIFNQNFCKRTT